MTAWQIASHPDKGALRVTETDPVLHAERTLPILSRPAEPVMTLPDGAIVTENGSQIWIKWSGAIHEWSFAGYGPAKAAPSDHMIVVTPPSTVAALRAGYLPEVHDTLLG